MKFKNSRSGAVCIKVINKIPHILVVQQWNKLFSIPKGKVERGESDQEAAKRELLEETGIDFNINTFNNEVKIFNDNYFMFDCSDMKIDLKIDHKEIIDIKWIPMNDIININSNSILKRIWHRQNKFLNKYQMRVQ